MKNPLEPLFPQEVGRVMSGVGLTKRDLVAALILAFTDNKLKAEDAAIWAIARTDALLSKL